jgi:hypothetical protein
MCTDSLHELKVSHAPSAAILADIGVVVVDLHARVHHPVDSRERDMCLKIALTHGRLHQFELVPAPGFRRVSRRSRARISARKRRRPHKPLCLGARRREPAPEQRVRRRKGRRRYRQRQQGIMAVWQGRRT